MAKVINRNTVKISYRCMPNMKKAIAGHNFQVQKGEEVEAPQYGCNCNGRCGPCPLDGGCLVDSVVYRAKVADNNGVVNTYTGLTSNTFKDRFYKHRNSFKYESKASATELSKHIWDVKNSGKDLSINWSIIDHAKPYKNGSKKCNLCLTEKFHIISSSINLVNKRTELVSKCRHENKFYLNNYKSVPPD